MKYTLHSSDTSSHFTPGPQIPQVTQPSGWLTPSHTSAQNHSAPSSTSTPPQPCSLYWSAHSGVTTAPIWAAILLRSLVIITAPKRDKIPLLVLLRKKSEGWGGKKEKYSGNESCNTILCVPSVSLSRDKRARERLLGSFLAGMWCEEQRGERRRLRLKCRRHSGLF